MKAYWPWIAGVVVAGVAFLLYRKKRKADRITRTLEAPKPPEHSK